MVPVRDAGHQHALEVGEDGVEGLAVGGRVGGERRGDLAGPDLREHGIAPGSAR